jgi:hypothetical protein
MEIEKGLRTHLPRTIGLDDGTALTLGHDLGLGTALLAVLDRDEDEGTERNRDGVPFRWCRPRAPNLACPVSADHTTARGDGEHETHVVMDKKMMGVQGMQACTTQNN